ncbi:MAG: hypothetical protein IJP92_00140, partial [Lachnospiraceae bacterium]|nr:hypothetical protein [Lachnospiraceae bacterium]
MMRLFQKMRRACCLTGCLLAVLFVAGTAHAEEEPSPASWTERIEAGDFLVLTKDPQELQSLLSRTYENLQAASRYVLQDINHDGAEELLWLFDDAGGDVTYVIAAFAKGADGVRTVLVAEQETSGGFLYPVLTDESVFFMNGERMLKLQHNTWLVSEFHCTEVLFDRGFDTFAGEGLTMYLVTDGDAYEAQVDAALKRRLSFLDGRGVRYFQIPVGSSTDEGIAIGADAFMEAFKELAGKPFAQIAPAYETMRTGIERGVARHVVAGRPGEEGNATSYPLAYPQIEEDASAFSPAINTILQQEAFSMAEGEVSYRILHDDDTMISVLFRSVNGEEGGEELKLLTVSKLNGRKIQIGDLTTTERIIKALEKNAAEVFALDKEMRRVRDDSIDKEAVKAAFEETVSASEEWKSIGMDEQYLYLSLRMSADRETLLRLPRWEAQVDSPGHMHLLTLHRAYPFLKDVLDDAECLTVRRRAGGFDIAYRTMDGGSVTARLAGTEEKRREFETPEQARDYYMAQYADVTGFATGTFERQDAASGDMRGDGGMFDTVETAFGEGGRAFIYAGERAYELTQRCQSTRGGFLLRRDSGLTDVAGTLRMEITGNGLWNNEQDGTRTEIRRMAEEKTFRFVFLKTEEEQYLMEIRRQ